MSAATAGAVLRASTSTAHSVHIRDFGTAVTGTTAAHCICGWTHNGTSAAAVESTAAAHVVFESLPAAVRKAWLDDMRGLHR